MIPRPRLLWCFCGAAIFFVAAAWLPWMAVFGLAANGLIVAAAVVDALRSPRAEAIEVSRDASTVQSVGTGNPVTLSLRSRHPQPLPVEVTDEPPAASRTEGLPFEATLVPAREIRATYQLYPRRRGPARFGAVHLRYGSPWSLWQRHVVRPLAQDVRIYPDIRAVRRFDLLARHNRLSEMGLKVLRLSGREGEFERLREYRREDELRHVDWSATAKHQKLISREFTTERNQNVVVLLDCGRSMRNETGGISHLDRGLNAALILSYIALGQGDKITFLAFSNRIERRVGPLRGKAAVQKLIQAAYDLEPRREVSDYALVCGDLERRQKKRALVLLITYALDDQHLKAIGHYARALVSNHLFLCVLVKDLPLAGLAERAPRTELEAFQIAAAAEMLGAQERRIQELRSAGVQATEVVPNELAAAMVNHYLDVKARHLL